MATLEQSEPDTLTHIYNHTGLGPTGLPDVELVRIPQVTRKTGQVFEL